MASTTTPADVADAQPSLLDDHGPGFETWQSGRQPQEPADVSDGEGSWSPPSGMLGDPLEEPLGPINWNTLTGDEAEAEWLDLNAWVNWLRGTYGLPPSIVPPLWHRHDELVWELSALHLHWINCYSPDASPSAPVGWHRDFADARNRLREWVAACGTRIDRDRPTRQTTWPGEPAAPIGIEQPITDRDADYVQFVIEDVTARRQIEQRSAS